MRGAATICMTMAASLCLTAVSGPLERSVTAASLEASAVAYEGEPTTQVVFQNIPIRLAEWAVSSDGTMMVPARELLIGLGYELDWEPSEEKLTASRPDGPILIFRAGKPEAEITEGGVVRKIPLDAAPYMVPHRIWIPLRVTVEASGLAVEWNPFDRTAIVRDPNERYHFTVTTRADAGTSDSPRQLQAYMKEHWQTDIRLSLISPEHYNEKTNVLIAAGDPADLMLIGDPARLDNETFRAIASDLTDMLGPFPRLKALAEADAPSTRRINGRIYGIPLPGDPHDAPFPAVRQDWLDMIGLQQPRTMDEMYEVLRRFAKYDPDGNGKHDTYGLTGYINRSDLGSFAWVEQAFTGTPGRFAIKAGTVIDTAVSFEERKALLWLAQAYAEGLVDKEFPLLKENSVLERMRNGYTGVGTVTADQAARLTVESASSGQKMARWVPLSGVKTDGAATISPWNSEGAGLYIIPRKVPADIAVRILDWLDHGIAMAETDKWRQVSGLEEADRNAIENLFGRKRLSVETSQAISVLPETLREQYRRSLDAWSDVDYSGLTIAGAEQRLARGAYANLNEELVQMKLKVITGKATIDEWDSFVRDMTGSRPYKQMLAQMNALLP